MNKVKVINVITRLIVGGAQETAIETCMLLDPSRFQAALVTGPQTGPEGELISMAIENKVPLTILTDLVREIDPLKDFKAYRKLVALFKEVKPHIVHTHSSKAGILGRWAARAAGVPVIVHTVHGWGHHNYQNTVKRNVLRFAERRSAGPADRLIAVSHLNIDKGLADKIGRPDQYVTIHSSVALEDFMDCPADCAALKEELGMPPGCKVVGTVGRLSPQKNPLDFIRVAARVSREVPEAVFLFIGDGPLRPETEALIEELGLQGKVFLPGIRRDVGALLQFMDVFIMTSLWEGLPRTIPQAMAAGLPVVANGVDGVCEIIDDGKNGFLTRPHDIAGMSAHILSLLGDGKLRARLAAAGREKALAEFSLPEMVRRIEKLYEEILEEKSIIV